MMNNRINVDDSTASDLGYPSNMEAHLSDQEARLVLHEVASAQIHAFIDALKMHRPASYESAIVFLEDIVKETASMDASAIADRMRLNNWEQFLSPQESLADAAENARKFFESDEGIVLINFVVQTISKTSGSMF